jgi:hypothetical protein
MAADSFLALVVLPSVSLHPLILSITKAVNSKLLKPKYLLVAFKMNIHKLLFAIPVATSMKDKLAGKEKPVRIAVQNLRIKVD